MSLGLAVEKNCTNTKIAAFIVAHIRSLSCDVKISVFRFLCIPFRIQSTFLFII